MDVAERINARIGQRTDGFDDGASAKGFEIFANVVWAELARSLTDELGSTLFAAGRPDEFRRVRTFTQTLGSESNTQLANAEPRDDPGIYPLSPIPCAVRACYSGDAYAPDVPIVRAAMAAACVLPAAVERDRDASRRRLVREQARSRVKLEERLVTFCVSEAVRWSMVTDVYNCNGSNSRNRPICDVLDGRSVVGDDYLLGQKCFCTPAGTPLLEAHVADTKSVSHMD